MILIDKYIKVITTFNDVKCLNMNFLKKKELSDSQFASTSLLVMLVSVFILIPQTYSEMFLYPENTSKTILTWIICLVIGIIIIFESFLSKRNLIFIEFNLIDVGFYLTFLYVLFNRYFLQSSYSFSSRFVELCLLVFLYTILRRVSYSWIIILLYSVIISGICQALYGNLQLLGFAESRNSWFVISGSFTNPGPFAGFIGIVWIISWGMFFFRKRIFLQLCSHWVLQPSTIKIFQYFSILIPSCGIVCIFFILPSTQSRAAWLATIIGLLIFLLHKNYSIFHIRSIKQHKLIVAILILFMCFGVYEAYSFKKESADGRLFIWKISSRIIEDNPLLGIGFDNFQKEYMKRQENYFRENNDRQEILSADNVFCSYNFFLQFIVENGLLGLCFVLILCYGLVKSKDFNEPLQLIAFVGLVGVVVFGFFSYVSHILPIKLLTVLLLASIANFKKDRRLTIRLESFVKTTIILSLLSAIVLNSGLIYKYSNFFYTWKKALVYYSRGLYNESIYQFESAYRLVPNNGEMLTNYGKVLFVNAEYSKSLEILREAKKNSNSELLEIHLGNTYKALKKKT